MSEELHKIILKVKKISDDSWNRPRLKNIETGKIYADVSLGDPASYPYFENGKCPYNIPGAWHSTTSSGEPDCPLSDRVEFELVEVS